GVAGWGGSRGGGGPARRVETGLLPPWFPVNIYAMSSWARGTVVPLALMMAHRTHAQVASPVALSELWLRPPTRADLRFARSPELVTLRNFFLAVDRVLKLGGVVPWPPHRRLAVARAIEWLVRHQDKKGRGGGGPPPGGESVPALPAAGSARAPPPT